MPESVTSRGRIFISYRRDETAYPAGWLFDRLTRQFGSGQVFKDVNSIEPGDDFVQKISQAVASCDVLLAVIGKEWLTLRDENGRRRLDNPDDFVRVEIQAALAREIRVIPVLVNEAAMPRSGDLPTGLADLTRRQAIKLSPVQFDYDTDRLLKVLSVALDEAQIGRPGGNPAPRSPQELRGRHRSEASQEPDEQEPASWQAELISRSRGEVVIRLYTGRRQHFLKFKRGLGKDTLSVDGEPVLRKSEFSQAKIPVNDEYGQIEVNFKLTKGYAMELIEASLNGLSYGVVKRIGPVQIAVDNLLVFEG